MAAYAFRVNGAERTVESWDPGQPLLYLLRNALGLTGPKFGCGLGQCGACAVLLDGVPTRSCLVPVSEVVGKSVVTVEGLGSPDKPDPVQAAFIAEQAAQCGYCTNGLVIATKALAARKPKPNDDQIRAALAGYLCRCGSHVRVLRAVRRAIEAAG